MKVLSVLTLVVGFFNAYSMQKSPSDKIALLRACAAGDEAGVVCLLHHAAGTDVVNQTNYFKKTPLHIAITLKKLSIVEVLCLNGASIFKPDGFGKLPIVMAANVGSIDIYDFLAAKYDPKSDEWHKIKKQVFFEGVRKGHTEFVQHLLQNGYNANVRCPSFSEFRWTALHGAANSSQNEMTTILLKHNANINARAGREVTALCCAIKTGNLITVRLLLESGAFPKSFSLIMHGSDAVKNKDISKEMASLLISYGAPCTHSALSHLMVDQSLVEMIFSPMEWVEKQREIPAEAIPTLAAYGSKLALIQALAKQKRDRSILVNALNRSAARGHVDVLSYLLSGDSAYSDAEKSYALRLAVINNHFGAIVVLIYYGACIHESIKVIAGLLMDEGIDAEKRNFFELFKNHLELLKKTVGQAKNNASFFYLLPEDVKVIIYNLLLQSITKEPNYLL